MCCVCSCTVMCIGYGDGIVASSGDGCFFCGGNVIGPCVGVRSSTCGSGCGQCVNQAAANAIGILVLNGYGRQLIHGDGVGKRHRAARSVVVDRVVGMGMNGVDINAVGRRGSFNLAVGEGDTCGRVVPSDGKSAGGAVKSNGINRSSETEGLFAVVSCVGNACGVLHGNGTFDGLIRTCRCLVAVGGDGVGVVAFIFGRARDLAIGKCDACGGIVPSDDQRLTEGRVDLNVRDAVAEADFGVGVRALFEEQFHGVVHGDGAGEEFTLTVVVVM